MRMLFIHSIKNRKINCFLYKEKKQSNPIKSKKQNEYSIEDEIIYFRLSNHALEYMIANLIRQHHYKTVPVTHIYIERYNSHLKNLYDFILLFILSS